MNEWKKFQHLPVEIKLSSKAWKFIVIEVLWNDISCKLIRVFDDKHITVRSPKLYFWHFEKHNFKKKWKINIVSQNSYQKLILLHCACKNHNLCNNKIYREAREFLDDPHQEHKLLLIKNSFVCLILSIILQSRCARSTSLSLESGLILLVQLLYFLYCRRLSLMCMSLCRWMLCRCS